MDDHERTERLTGHPVEPGTEPTARLDTHPDEPPAQPEPPAAPAYESAHGAAYGAAYEAAPQASEDRTERRQLSVAHLVAGLVFLGISALWLAQEVGAVAVEDMELLVPMLLVVVGATGLLAGLVRAARRG